MTYTRKQVVTCISILYLIFVTALSAYASCRANRLSVPIPNALSGFTTVLPVVAGLLLEGGYDLTRRQERRQHLARGEMQRPPLVIVANTLIFIYSTVIITLLGTYVAPASELDCGLRNRWQTLFRRKDREAIQTIQDAFRCCGYANSRDMAWPFPDKSHDQRACENAFGRTNGCLSAWKGEEQRMAGILMVVVVLVFLWQFAIIAIPTKRESWLHRVAPDRISRMLADERHGDDSPQRAIDYLPNFNRYTDRVDEISDEENSNGARRVIEDGAARVKNTLTRAVGDEEQRQPSVENAWSRNE